MSSPAGSRRTEPFSTACNTASTVLAVTAVTARSTLESAIDADDITRRCATGQGRPTSWHGLRPK